MPLFSAKPCFVLLLAALCLGGRPAEAQSGPMSYSVPDWIGFGGNLNAGQGANTDGNVAGFSSSTSGGFSATRYSFSSGWFVGSERGSMGLGTGLGTGLGLSGINQPGGFGTTYVQGAQFGYALKNSPVTIYAGFDSLKSDSGLGSAFASPNALTGTTSGYRVHTGVEFKPTSNMSLSLGAGFTQQSGRVDTDTQSAPLSTDSQFGLVGVRR